MVTSSRCSQVLALLLLTSVNGRAQGTTENAGFIATLGRDTVALERFTRSATSLDGSVLVITTSVQLYRFHAALRPNGSVSNFNLTVAAAAGSLNSPPTITADIVIDDSTVVTRQVNRGRRDSTRYRVRPGAVPQLANANSIALYEQLLRHWQRARRDSVAIDQVYAGLTAPLSNYVVRTAADSVRMDFFGTPVFARFDNGGRLLGLDGTRSTNGIRVSRVPAFDFDSAANAILAQVASRGRSTILSPREAAQATIAGASLNIDYGAPSKRGRVIFGTLVPWGNVWITGANRATHFTTSKSLIINGGKVPAGTYTLWTIPSQGGVQLIINRWTGEFTTPNISYDSTQDLLRVPMRVERTTDVLERLKWSVVITGDQSGEVRLEWDDAVWSVPFSVAPKSGS